MARAEKPPCKSAREFIAFHLGREAFAPLTGQDSRALSAFIHLLELYAVVGDGHAIEAMRAVLPAMQEKCWFIAAYAIPGVLDWGDTERLWRQIAPQRAWDLPERVRPRREEQPQ